VSARALVRRPSLPLLHTRRADGGTAEAGGEPLRRYTEIGVDDVRKALERGGSIPKAAALLGVSKQVVVNRVTESAATDAPIVWPPVHDGPTAPEMPEAPEVRLRHEMAIEAAERKVKDATEQLRAAKGELRSQEEFVAEVVRTASCPVQPPDFPPLVQDAHKPHRSVVVQIADIHGGQKVSRCDTGGNVYDWDIMLERMGRFFNGVVGSLHNIMGSYCIDDLALAYTGDIIEGYKVFKEQGYQLCKDAGAQVVEGAAAWASFEASLQREMAGVPMRRKVVPGNHGLPEGRKGGAVTSTINYEYVWHELLVANTENLGIPSDYATDGRLAFEVAGQPCLITHGDEIRGQLGIPFYGIRTAWMKHTQELDYLFRYWFFGHIHQTSNTSYGDGAALSSGDAVGYNNLTGKLRNPSSTPQQSVYFLSRERGLDEISYIHLVEKNPTKEGLKVRGIQ